MGLPRRLILLLCLVMGVQIVVEALNHIDRGFLPQRWLDYAALALLPAELLLLVGLTRPVRRRARERRRARRRIKRALAKKTLTTAFQPIHDLGTGMVIGLEALSRFPARRIRPPDVWFAEAHQVGLGLDLELLAVRTALRGAAALPGHLHVSVNVAPSTLSSPRLLQHILNSSIPPSRVVLELTEHVRVEDYPALSTAIEPLRLHGVSLAVDDAGAGYASARHILNLKPEIIKLDRDLIADIDRDCARQALAAAMVSFARHVGSVVIAEGIERHAELDTLRELGVDGAQGYLLGAPSTDPDQWRRWVGEAGKTAASRPTPPRPSRT